jgi:hypothetical protein
LGIRKYCTAKAVERGGTGRDQYDIRALHDA